MYLELAAILGSHFCDSRPVSHRTPMGYDLASFKMMSKESTSLLSLMSPKSSDVGVLCPAQNWEESGGKGGVCVFAAT